MFDNDIRYAYVSKMFDKSIAQLMHHSVKMFGCSQAQGFVGPDMGPNQCLKRISADGPSSFHSIGIDQLSCSRTPNSLDQARLFVRPDMVSKCLIILLSAVRPGPAFCWVFCYCSQHSLKYS